MCACSQIQRCNVWNCILNSPLDIFHLFLDQLRRPRDIIFLLKVTIHNWGYYCSWYFFITFVMNQFDELHDLQGMPECFGPNSELLLLFSDFCDTFYEGFLYFELKLQKLYCWCWQVLLCDFLQFWPLYLWTLLME